MSDNDLIRRGDAIALTCDPFGAETVTSQAINAIPAALPTVKPLVWDAFGKECVRSETVLGRYEIMWGFHNGQTSLDIPAPRRTHVWHPTLEAAKAAAQADYEARILSALDMQPTVSPKQLAARPDDVEALLEDFSAVLRYVPDSVVECRGDKCREPWCASCCGWDDAEEAIAVAHEAGKRARAALARVKGVM